MATTLHRMTRWLRRSGVLGPVTASVLMLASVAALGQASIKARTSDGRDVILRSDGTWSYATGEGATTSPRAPQPENGSTAIGQAATIPTPPARPLSAAQPPTAAQPLSNAHRPGLPVIQRPRDATTQIATRRGDFRFWFNPQKWRAMPENVDGRFQLQLIGSEAYIAVIPEGTPIPIAQLKTLALENAAKSGSNAQIVSEERRMIGGREVLAMQISVTIDKTPVVFIGYYFGDPRGSIQVVGYTSERDLPRVKALLLEGLDGLDLNR